MERHLGPIARARPVEAGLLANRVWVDRRARVALRGPSGDPLASLLRGALYTTTLSTSLQAQEWSSDELDLFAHVRHCWDGYGVRSWDDQVRECGLDDSLQYWWTEEDEPRGIDWMRDAVKNEWPQIEVLAQDFDPVRVTREGSSRFLFYRGRRTIRSEGGDIESVAWLGMEIWRRTGSGWTYFGGTGTPVPINQPPP